MRYYTATAAAKIIGVTDRTIRDWIKDGKLTAHHPQPNRLAIAESDVERLARERKQYDVSIPDAADLAARLAELEQKYARLEQELAELRNQRAIAPVYTAPLIEREPRMPVTRTYHRTLEPERALPDGAILARDFAKQHGVNPSTFRDHYTKGLRGEVLTISGRPKPNREHETEYYLLPDEQELARNFWRRNGVPFNETPGQEE